MCCVHDCVYGGVYVCVRCKTRASARVHILVTTGALLEVGLFVSSLDSEPKDANVSPEFQSASDFRCRLAGDLLLPGSAPIV